MALGINHVMVVHGRNSKARDAMFAFIRSLGLWPIEWEDAIREAGGGSPFTGNVAKNAIEKAGAVIVLLTADDIAKLRPMYVSEDDGDEERQLTGQPRPNVLIEFGMALIARESKTIIVELERTRSISDTWGRNGVRYSGNEPVFRATIRSRLEGAGCEVKLTGTDWLREGDFKHAVAPPISAEFRVGPEDATRSIEPTLPTPIPAERLSADAPVVPTPSSASLPSNAVFRSAVASPNPPAENAARKLARRIRRFVSTRASRQARAPSPLPDYDALDEDYDYLHRLSAEFIQATAQQEYDDYPARLATDFIFRFHREVADIHALFSRIGIRDVALDRLLLDDHALTFDSHRPMTPETMLAIADGFDALATKQPARLEPAFATLVVRIVAQNGTLVDQAAVITVSPEGNGGDLVHTNERGVAHLSVPGAAGYTLLVAHRDYVGEAAALDLDQDTVAEITLAARAGYSSTIIEGGYGEIPGLKGHLNPNDGDKMSLYALRPDIAINGGKHQPVPFVLHEELRLKDTTGAVFLVRFEFLKNRTSLVQYTRVLMEPGSESAP